MSPIVLAPRNAVQAQRMSGRAAAAMLMALGVGVATAVPAHADNVLNVSGQQWNIHQNNGYVILVNLQQDAQGNLTGSATTRGLDATNTVTGTVNLSHIHLEIPWNGGTTTFGIYDGDLHANAHASGCHFDGVTHDKMTPTATATWWSDGMNFEPCPNG